MERVSLVSLFIWVKLQRCVETTFVKFDRTWWPVVESPRDWDHRRSIFLCRLGRKIRYANPTNHSIPSWWQLKNMFWFAPFIHFHPFFTLYGCKFVSFSLNSLSWFHVVFFYVCLRESQSGSGQKGLKGCTFFPKISEESTAVPNPKIHQASASDKIYILYHHFVHFCAAMLRFCRSCAEICTWRRPATVQWLLGPCQPCGRPGILNFELNFSHHFDWSFEGILSFTNNHISNTEYWCQLSCIAYNLYGMPCLAYFANLDIWRLSDFVWTTSSKWHQVTPQLREEFLWPCLEAKWKDPKGGISSPVNTVCWREMKRFDETATSELVLERKNMVNVSHHIIPDHTIHPGCISFACPPAGCGARRALQEPRLQLPGCWGGTG